MDEPQLVRITYKIKQEEYCEVMATKVITLGALIEQLMKISEEHGEDIDVWIRTGRSEHLLTGVRYTPETETEYDGVILRG